jgi:CBS domain-containing protein
MPHHVVADIDAPELESIKSDTTIEDALDQMIATGSPQLGVMSGDELVGVVSHRDITRVLRLST